MTKTFYINRWDDWEDLCDCYNIDPYENVDFGVDKGGGDSFNYEYIGEIPEEEEE